MNKPEPWEVTLMVAICIGYVLIILLSALIASGGLS